MRTRRRKRNPVFEILSLAAAQGLGFIVGTVVSTLIVEHVIRRQVPKLPAQPGRP